MGKMKLCMMSYTMARRPELFSIRSMLELTRELGLDAIDYVTLHDTPAAELRKVTDDFGIAVACHTFIADLNFANQRERQPGIDAAKRGIEAAVALGAGMVMIPTPGKEGVPRAESRRNIIEGLKEVCDIARQAGVTATVENFGGAKSPFVIADDVLEAIREVPGLALTFDSGNVLTGGEDPALSFARCAEHTIHAHFKDWRLTDPGKGLLGLDGRWYQGAVIGEGIVDHRSCLEAMKRAGYGGHINIEYEGNDYTPAEATRRAAAYLRGIMAETGQ
jgi:sugar phosphate isomerase/epimerase